MPGRSPADLGARPRLFVPRSGLGVVALLSQQFPEPDPAHRLLLAVSQGFGLRQPRFVACPRLGPAADQLQHLAKFHLHFQMLTVIENGEAAPEVVDGRGVCVARLRRLAGPAEVFPAFRQVLAAVVVVGQQVDDLLPVLARRSLQVLGNLVVQHRPGGERQAVVGDFLRHDMLEQIGLLGFLVDGGQFDVAQQTERTEHLRFFPLVTDERPTAGRPEKPGPRRSQLAAPPGGFRPAGRCGLARGFAGSTVGQAGRGPRRRRGQCRGRERS